MKPIKDIDVNDHCYYFLLDFNDTTSFYFLHILGVDSLRNCHSEQFDKLWTIATQIMPVEVNQRNNLCKQVEIWFRDFFTNSENVYVLVFDKLLIIAKHGNFVILDIKDVKTSHDTTFGNLYLNNDVITYMVEQGFEVFWSNKNYVVKKDNKEFIIDYQNGKNVVGLKHKDQITYNTTDFSCFINYTKIPLSL